jgi:hypothetical protein
MLFLVHQRKEESTGKVSPTMVSITPTGFQVTAEVGWQGHQTDPLVDISITGGHSWTARADYIQ